MIEDFEEYYHKYRGKHWMHDHFMENEERLAPHMEAIVRNEENLFGVGADNLKSVEEVEAEDAARKAEVEALAS